MNAIEIKGLCKSYKDFKIDNIDLTLPGGCVVGLIGENGAGKSTTIKLILNIAFKDSGTIKILGRDNEKELDLVKEDIGVVFDESYFPPELNAKNIGNILKNIYKNWNDKQYNEYIEKFGLPLKKSIKKYSKGMKMKLSIAAAMSHNAKLLILDEATSGLDPVMRDEIIDILTEFTRDEAHSILISSHIVSDLEKICDYIAFLHKGKIVLHEEKDKLYEQYGVIHCSTEELEKIKPSSVIGKKVGSYGAEAIVLKSDIPSDIKAYPIDIEKLFIFMIKESV